MAILKQNANSNTTFLGWYGKCGEPKCHDFNLMEAKDTIASVYQFTESGQGTKTFVSSVPDFMQGLTKLVCGTSYWVVLHKGDGEIDIPEFTIGHFSESGNLGSIADDCYAKKPDPTPTPTPTNDDKLCTQDMRECPDGSSVSRDSQCRFPPCGWSPSDFREAGNRWKHNQPIHHKFNFKYIGKGDVASTGVCIEVRFGKIVKIKKLESSDYISLDFNDSISDADEKNKTKMRFRTIDQLFAWIHLSIKARPYSVEIDYDQGLGFPEKLLVDKSEKETDDKFGFEIWNFEELEYKGKCPPDKRRCSNGTYVKRDPENNCKFHDCPELATPTPVGETPKLKFRWLYPPKGNGLSTTDVKESDMPTIQVQGAINPWNEDEVEHLPWRTVYGSTNRNPKDVDMDHWKPLRVSADYIKNYGNRGYWDGVKYTVDYENDNQIYASPYLSKVGIKFHPESESTGPSERVYASHLYLCKDGTQTSIHNSWEFPHMKKTLTKIISAESGMIECEDDIQMCEDGSYVERNPDGECEFYPCPGDDVDFDPDYDSGGDDDSGETSVPELDTDDTFSWPGDNSSDGDSVSPDPQYDPSTTFNLPNDNSSDDDDNGGDSVSPDPQYDPSGSFNLPNDNSSDGDDPLDGDPLDGELLPDLDDDSFDMDDGDSFDGDPFDGDPFDGDLDGDPLDGDPLDDELLPDLDDDSFDMDDGDSFDGDPFDGDSFDGDPFDGDPFDGDPLDGDLDGDPLDGDPLDGDLDGDSVITLDDASVDPAGDLDDLFDIAEDGTPDDISDDVGYSDDADIPSGDPAEDENQGIPASDDPFDFDSPGDADSGDIDIVDYEDSVDLDDPDNIDVSDFDTIDVSNPEDPTDFNEGDLGSLDPLDGDVATEPLPYVNPDPTDEDDAPDLSELTPEGEEGEFQPIGADLSDVQPDQTFVDIDGGLSDQVSFNSHELGILEELKIESD
jgi:hypothetical protein